MIIADILFLRKKYFLYDTVSTAIWTLNMNLNQKQEMKLLRELLDNIKILELEAAKETFGRWMVQAFSKKERILIVVKSPQSIGSIESEDQTGDQVRDEQEYQFDSRVKILKNHQKSIFSLIEKQKFQYLLDFGSEGSV